MTKDNSTGKPKDFYSRGQQMFNSLNLPDDDDDTQSYTSDVALAEAYRCGFEAGALEQQAEPTCPSCKAAVLYECVACSSNNYPTQQQAEPVAWMSSDRAWMWSDYSKAMAAVANIPTLTLIPLYATPPQRPWVDLTDEDWEHIHDRKGTALDTFAQGAVWAADRLKERNT